MTPPTHPPRLLDRYREEMVVRHYAKRTVQSYVGWVRRYLRFHQLRHPREMGQEEINAFLTHLAVKEKLAASSQNQALAALLFLYRTVLGGDVGSLEGVVRAHRPRRLPVVLSEDEVRRVLGHLQGPSALVGQVLYGSGCFPNSIDGETGEVENKGAITWIRACRRKRCVPLCKRRGSISRPRATPCAIRLPPTFLPMASTSAPFKSCWGTAM
jgi:integrase